MTLRPVLQRDYTPRQALCEMEIYDCLRDIWMVSASLNVRAGTRAALHGEWEAHLSFLVRKPTAQSPNSLAA